MGKVKTVGGKDYTQDAQGQWYEVESPVQKEELKMKVVDGVTYQKDADGNWFTREEVKKKVGGEGSAMPSQSKSTSELPSTETGINFNELNAMKGGSNRATPQQKDIVQYGENVSKGAIEKHEKDIADAVNNTAKLYFENNPSLLKSYNLTNKKSTGEKFSLTQLRNATPYQQKVSELKTKLDSGEYGVYTANTGEKRLQRKTGDWDNFKSGVSEAWNANKKVDEYLSMSKEQKIKFLNDFKPDTEYLPEKPDASSGLYQFGAAVPTTGKMLAAGATGAVLAAAVPETGGLSTAGLPAVLAWASVVPDMAKQNQMSAEIEAFHEAKRNDLNMSDEDALKIAKDAGTIGYASGLAKGTLMNVIGQGSLPPNVGQGLIKATGQFLKNQPQSISEIGYLSIGTSLAEHAGKKALGLPDEDWATKAGEVLKSDVIGQLAFNVAFGLAAAPKYVKAQANEVLSKMDTEALQMIQQRAIDEGLITEQQANDATKDLQDYKAAKAKVPPMDSEEKTAVIAGLIQKKQNLEKAKTETDKSFHDELDAQIEAADQRIQLAKKSNDPIKYAEQDDLDGTKNFTPKTFENLSKKEVEGIAEEVPKEYGEAEAIEVGGDAEGAAKKYKAEATVTRQQGFIKIKDKIPVDDKVYNDKADAEAAAQKALAQHYYENAMDETLKPEQKSSVTVIRPEENKAPEIVENVKTETQTEGSNKGGVTVQYPATRLSYKGTQELANEFGIPEREATVVKHDLETIREADELLNKGWDADDAVKKINESGGISDASYINLTRYAAKLSDDLRGMNPKSADFAKTIAELNRIAKASDLAGQQQGRDLGIRGRFKILADDSLAEFWVRELEANKDAPLTENQKEEAQTKWDNLQKAKEEHAANVEKLAAERAKFEAEKVFKKQKSTSATTKTKKTKEDFTKERTSFKEQLAASKAKHEQWLKDNGISKQGASPFVLTTDMAKIIGKIVKSHIDEQVNIVGEKALELAKVIKKVLDEVKDILPDATERDIHDVIRGAYNEKKQTKSEVAKIAEDLRIEAQSITELEKLLKEETPKSEKRKIKRNQRIEILKQKIKGYKKEEVEANKFYGESDAAERRIENKQDELQRLKDRKPKVVEEKEKREISEREQKLNEEIVEERKKIRAEEKEVNTFYREPKSVELKALETIKRRNEKETSKINEKKEKGEYEPDVKKTPLLEDIELKSRLPKAFADAKKSQDELIKAKQEIEFKRLKQMYENRSAPQKFADQATRYLNVPRTLMASMDFSAPLRQAIVATTAHPIIASKAFGTMFQHAFSQKKFDRWFHDIQENPKFEEYEKSGLYLSNPHDLKLTAREEAFLGNIAEKIPLAGRFVKGSERAYVSYLNKMRWDLFDMYATQLKEKGRTLENSPDLYKSIAAFVNNATGRGNMHFKTLESASNALNAVFFSPRLIASRLNLLAGFANPQLYKPGNAKLRAMYYADMGKFIGTGLATLALMKYGFGADVEADPRSTDFGKVKFGNTRWDIWGGFQPYVRVLSQILSGKTKSSTSGEIKELDAKEAFGRNEGTIIADFMRAKAAPLIGMGWDIASRRTILGEKVNRELDNPFSDADDPKEGITLTDEMLRHVLPLISRDISEGYKEGGVFRALGVGLPSIFGVGVNTFEPKEPKSKKTKALSNN